MQNNLDSVIMRRLVKFEREKTGIKQKLPNLLKRIFVLTCTLLLLVVCTSCNDEDSPYDGKECVNCGATPSVTISGTRPLNANDKNCEKISSGIYRIFYCDTCFAGVPKVTGP